LKYCFDGKFISCPQDVAVQLSSRPFEGDRDGKVKKAMAHPIKLFWGYLFTLMQ